MSAPDAAETAQPASIRQQSAIRTRNALVEAGFRLAASGGLAGLSVNRIVAEADVSKGSFFHHFGDRASYLVALHRDFHDRILTETLRIVDGSAPGVWRLATAGRAYLDSCLRNRAVRALLLEARAEPAITDAVRQRNNDTADLIEPDFAAMGWAHPRRAAQLWIGMTAEAALLELDAGQHLADLRASLARYIGAEPALFGC